MNRIFKSIWNKVSATWVAVSERVAARGKRTRLGSSPALANPVSAALPVDSQKLRSGSIRGHSTPSGGTVSTPQTAGCTISTAGSTLTVGSTFTGWLNFTGSNTSLLVNPGGGFVSDINVPGISQPSGISASSSSTSWPLINNGNITAAVGTLAFDLIGLRSSGTYTITNVGTILESSPSAGAGAVESDASNVSLTLTNSGSITTAAPTADIGMSGAASILKITNSGSLSSSGGRAISMTGGGGSFTLANQLGGLIDSNANAGSTINIASGNTIDIVNYGIVRISNAGANAITSAGLTTIRNGSTGVISAPGPGMLAIQLGTSNDTVILEPGSSITGIVDAGGGTNTLALGGNIGSGIFNLALIDASQQYRNFSVFDKRENDTWTLTGTNTGTERWTLNGGTLAIASGSTLNGSVTTPNTSSASVALQVAGTIDNGSGVAIDMEGGGDNSVVLNAGAAFGKSTFTVGAGIVTLTGPTAFPNTVTIAGGTLQVGDGGIGTGGAIAGDIVDNSSLIFNHSDDITFAGVVSGSGTLAHSGTGTLTLTGTGSSAGATTVAAGTLAFAQLGAFNAADYTTQSGATTSVGGTSQLAVTGAFTQAAGSAPDVTLGSNSPVITAGTAALDGTLSIVGFSADAPSLASALEGTRFTVISTTGGITGNFASISLGSATSTLDYLTLSAGARRSADNLTYGVGFGLTWQAGATQGNGVFTLTSPTDAFNVDVVLADQAASATGWNGTDLTKSGAGTLTLSALNTYTGQTIVNSGTLAMGIANAIAPSSAVTVNSGATLALNDFSQTANNLSGAGAINLGSLATTVLTASNNATDTTFAGNIGGAGLLNKTGAAALTLSGVNTYTGGTTITAGTLSGSATSFGTGAILDNASLDINQPADASFANAINGTGTLTKSGAGALNLTGTSALSGATTVAAGRLAVNGSLANSAINVQNGAILGGNGTIGRTSILSGGTIAPGNSIGMLTVSGTFTQSAGFTYQAQVDPGTTASDLIRVNGAATLAPGATLNVVRIAPGEYSANSHYTVLTATGGVRGTYILTGDIGGAFYTLTDTYDRNNVYLNAVRVRNFVDAAQTPNQIATAAALQNLPAESPIKNAVNALATDADARRAFNQLSGEIHASIKTALMEDSRYIRDVAVDRVLQSFCMPGAAKQIATARLTSLAASAPVTGNDECTAYQAEPVVWAHVFGAWGHVNGDGDATTLRQNLGGFLVGTDTTIAQQWRVGALAGYSGGSFNADDRNSSAGSDNYHVGLYGGTQFGNVGIRAGAAYTWHSINTTRAPAFAGYADNLKDSYNAHTAQVFGDIGYRMAVQQAALEPFASVAYVNLHASSVNEQGGRGGTGRRRRRHGLNLHDGGCERSVRFRARQPDGDDSKRHAWMAACIRQRGADVDAGIRGRQPFRRRWGADSAQRRHYRSGVGFPNHARCVDRRDVRWPVWQRHHQSDRARYPQGPVLTVLSALSVAVGEDGGKQMQPSARALICRTRLKPSLSQFRDSFKGLCQLVEAGKERWQERASSEGVGRISVTSVMSPHTTNRAASCWR
jgi:outer membrane autotransporter protein